MPEGQLLWTPSDPDASEMARFMRARGFSEYDELWRWSVEDLDGFWGALWEWFEIEGSYDSVLGSAEMPGAEWFPGASLNYAERLFRAARPGEPAIAHATESSPLAEMTWDELADQVARCAAGLRRLGVERGDRVAAYMPNVPETVVAFLACASIGAVWSSCAPEFGTPTVVDRFKQIEPKVLIATDGYRYGGKDFDRRDRVAEIVAAIPSIEHTVHGAERVGRAARRAGRAHLRARAVRPPAVGALLVRHHRAAEGDRPGAGRDPARASEEGAAPHDLSPGDRFFWFTTTGWMMWNFLVGGLLAGATIVLYDGQPDPARLWDFAAEARVTTFGTSAGFIGASMKAGVTPEPWEGLRAVGSTGSPLPVEGFDWVYERFPDVWLFSTSGGTDLCTAFVGGCPLLPVYSGELQARCLGASVESWSEDGRPLVNEVGELVITRPMPSMPIYFWGDPDGERYRSSYFEMFPGVWRHGDWIKITDRGTAVIYGRSDSTINRGGVRMGTSEIYSAVEGVEEVLDSLVVDVEDEMILFVVVRDQLTDEVVAEIRRRIREHCSPRHLPDRVVQIPEVPRTLSNKKLEVPVKKILLGAAPESAASRDSLANPEALDWVAEFAVRAS